MSDHVAMLWEKVLAMQKVIDDDKERWLQRLDAYGQAALKLRRSALGERAVLDALDIIDREQFIFTTDPVVHENERQIINLLEEIRKSVPRLTFKKYLNEIHMRFQDFYMKRDRFCEGGVDDG